MEELEREGAAGRPRPRGLPVDYSLGLGAAWPASPSAAKAGGPGAARPHPRRTPLASGSARVNLGPARPGAGQAAHLAAHDLVRLPPSLSPSPPAPALQRPAGPGPGVGRRHRWTPGPRTGARTCTRDHVRPSKGPWDPFSSPAQRLTPG